MIMLRRRWQNTTDYLAQMVHFLGGALLVSLSKEAGYNPWWGVLLVFLFTGVKELWMDTPDLTFLPGAGWWEREDPDTLQGSLVDWFFWTVGAVIYRLLLAWFWAGLTVGLLWVTFMILYYGVRSGTEYD